MEEKTKEIISFLESEMIKQKMNRQNLANKIGVEPSQIKRMFDFQTKISFDLVIKTAIALKVKEFKIL